MKHDVNEKWFYYLYPFWSLTEFHRRDGFLYPREDFRERKRIKSKGSEFTKLTEQFYTFKIWCLQIMAPLTVHFEARIWTQVSWINISIENSSPRIVTFKVAVTGTSTAFQRL